MLATMTLIYGYKKPIWIEWKTRFSAILWGSRMKYKSVYPILLILLLAWSPKLLAQANEASADEPQGGEPGWIPPEPKTFSQAEVQAECRKYQDKLISYFTQVFKVENCKRREIQSDEFLLNWTRQGKPIFSVENDTIIKLPLGQPITSTLAARAFNCQLVEGRYVISGNNNVFYVQNCQRRAFPDWETFSAHRMQHKLTKQPMVELSESELQQLQPGPPVPTVFDDSLQAAFDAESQIDIIPVDEACRGLNGRYVTYYSRVYRIEQCRKREIVDPDLSGRRQFGTQSFVELSSEQWLSLPDGEPITKL